VLALDVCEIFIPNIYEDRKSYFKKRRYEMEVTAIYFPWLKFRFLHEAEREMQ